MPFGRAARRRSRVYRGKAVDTQEESGPGVTRSQYRFALTVGKRRQRRAWGYVMTDLFAARPVRRGPLVINKALLRGAIWLAALTLFVCLPKPAGAAYARLAAASSLSPSINCAASVRVSEASACRSASAAAWAARGNTSLARALR